MRPPPKLRVSEWADKYRKLSPESSAEPGQWFTARNEPMRAVMDAACDPAVTMVTVMSSAQVGKTETINNLVAYYVDQDPSPILMLQPTLQMGEAWSKDRLAPMLRDTPRLAGKVKDPRSRDSGNTLLHKTFPGGHITISGANSPASLASRPVRVVLCDEVDRYPASAGAEGDPVNLAMKRSTTFWNRKTILTSTPTIKGHSRIEAAYMLSDQRKFWVPCPDCGHHQVLQWAQVKWPEGKPRDAAYGCVECGSLWDDPARWRAIRKGEWRASSEFKGNAGFHINEIYSSWVKLGDMATNFLDSKRSPETFKTWVNTSLGETWEADAEKIDPHSFADNLETWEDGAPLGVLLVTCGVDVQADRLEIERVGWGVDEESWSLDHHVIHGDPSDPEVWRRLDAYLAEPTVRADGRTMHVRTTCVDSGGHHTQAVYRFCRLRKSRRIFAIKGRDEAQTVWPSGLKARKGKSTDVTIVGVTAAKDAVYARLKVRAPGPGYCHFPKGRSVVWFEQLTSEEVQTKYTRGFPRRVYVLPDGRRNEALDCRVYAYAALQSLGIRWGTEMTAAAPLSPSAKRDIPAPAVIAQVAERAATQAKPARSGGFLQARRPGGWLTRR
jgi:phage terminase large subunit GpA-like protein